MALPISAFGAVVTFTGNSGLIGSMQLWRWPIVLLLFVFSLLGLMMMLYISALRAEALLYARQVNAERDYYFLLEESEKDILSELVLPRNPKKPKIDAKYCVLIRPYRYPIFYRGNMAAMS